MPRAWLEGKIEKEMGNAIRTNRLGDIQIE